MLKITSAAGKKRNGCLRALNKSALKRAKRKQAASKKSVKKMAWGKRRAGGKKKWWKPKVSAMTLQSQQYHLAISLQSTVHSVHRM